MGTHPIFESDFDCLTEMKVGIVTLATNNEYAKGAVVLARSLRRVGTSAELLCMISADVSEGPKLSLEMTFDRVVTIDIFDSQDAATLAELGRAELGVTWTKLWAWKFTEYSKMIFMDCDMIVLKSIDELFDREELSAVPDCGWPSIFNSGLFVFKPSTETYEAICKHAKENKSWDGGDQGLLNSYFSDWSTKDISRILPFGYNVHAAATYAYLPAFRQFQDQIKVIHFLGSAKPWTSQQSPAGPFNQFWNMWWDIYKNNDSPSCVTSGYAAPVSEQKVEYAPKSAPPPTKSAPSVGSIEDILTHIDKQLSADDQPSEQ